jgi:hypothetical protein
MRPLVCWLALTRKTAVFLLLTLLAFAAGTQTSGAHIFGDAKQVNLSGKWRLNQQLSAYSAEPIEEDVLPEKASDSLIVETKTARGSRLTETFELSPDRNHLMVSVKIVGGRTRPILIRRVYDRETSQHALNG